MFDEEFLNSLPSDPIQSIHKMCVYFQNRDRTLSYNEINIVKFYDDYIEAFAALETFIDAFDFRFTPKPQLGSVRADNIETIRKFFNAVFGIIDKKIIDNSLTNARDKFRSRFGKVFVYEFSEGDLKRIQSLLNELRDLITASELFDAKHKDRILKKLESLQRELHKKMSSVDNFWGLIGDAGVALGKFGKDAKPFVAIIREIAMIVWCTQARAEELPSGTPLPLLTAERKELESPDK